MSKTLAPKGRGGFSLLHVGRDANLSKVVVVFHCRNRKGGLISVRKEAVLLFPARIEDSRINLGTDLNPKVSFNCQKPCYGETVVTEGAYFMNPAMPRLRLVLSRLWLRGLGTWGVPSLGILLQSM